MQLLTKGILEKLPPLYATESQEDPTIWVKFFYPDHSWTWYGIEFDGENIFFGFVVGFEDELGYFSLKELQESRPGVLKSPLERDRSFTPCRLSKIQNEVGR
jgi:hypothetical protein